MSAALPNVTTGDRYVDAETPGAGLPAGTDSTTLRCPGAVRIVLLVANAGIYYQRGMGAPPAWDEPEAVLLPGYFSFARRCDAVRVRSLAAGAPAQVSIEALTAAEVGAT